MPVNVPDISCPKCGGHFFHKEFDADDRTTSLVCIPCGCRIELTREAPHQVDVPVEDKGAIQRKLPGLSRAELQRRYRDSPVGQKAWERYRYSELFYQAHARHRQTEKYKETQERFKQKRRLFQALLNPPLESTCPIGLFHRGKGGEIYNNTKDCDYDGKDCQLGCLNQNGEQDANYPS